MNKVITMTVLSGFMAILSGAIASAEESLQDLIKAMDADLGISKIGPGVRPSGKVQKSKPLLKDKREYS